MEIRVEITSEQEKIIQSAFPETNVADTALKLVELMADEFFMLISGNKRYLSLSHQYIEWVQKIYEEEREAESLLVG